MKPIYIFMHVVVWPLISWGQFCDKGSVLAKTWRAQKEWYREDSVPSKENPQLKFETLVDTTGARHVLPYNIKTHFNSKMTVASSLDKSGETKEFTKYCADDKMSMILTKNRLDTSNNSQFRIPIRNYLPLQVTGDKNTSLLITSKNGLTAKVYLNKESIVKNNDAILNAYGEDSIESVLSKKITDRLQNQLTSANSGTVVLNLDGMDDLACDLLRGRADIDFYHFGEMDNAEVKMIQPVNPQEVMDIYSDLVVEIPPLNSKEESYFVAGRITMQHMLNAAPSSIDTDKKSFEITSQFFDTKGSFLKGLIPNDELVCLAENQSQFEKKRNNAWIQLNLNLQTLTNLITNNK